LYPRRIWLGDSLVVSFCQLLCTTIAIISQYVQSSGDMEVTNHRYCLIHWFFLSDIPSVCGWNTDDKF
jgi:hypothetical protein